jgi:hypothetical protein
VAIFFGEGKINKTGKNNLAKLWEKAKYPKFGTIRAFKANNYKAYRACMPECAMVTPLRTGKG